MEPVVIEEDDRTPVAKSARKGLEAIEDYSAAKGALKEVDTSSPYPPKMLIRVKGGQPVRHAFDEAFHIS